MHPSNDESLRELGKTKYAAKAALSRFLAEREGINVNPDWLFNILISRSGEGQTFAARKIRELRKRLEENPCAAVPATVFVIAGNISEELFAEAQRLSGSRAARRIGMALLPGIGEEETGLLAAAAEIAACPQEMRGVFARYGALELPFGDSFAEYLSSWETLALESGTLAFLQKEFFIIASAEA